LCVKCVLLFAIVYSKLIHTLYLKSKKEKVKGVNHSKTRK